MHGYGHAVWVNLFGERHAWMVHRAQMYRVDLLVSFLAFWVEEEIVIRDVVCLWCKV